MRFDHPRCILKLGPTYATWIDASRHCWGTSRQDVKQVALPAGLIRPSPFETNISDVPALARELRGLIETSVRTWSAKPILLVLSDLCVRTTLLELEKVPAQQAERDALIRWRLEREACFPMTGAKVLSQEVGPKTVLAVAIRESVLQQYEAACEAVGLLAVDVDIASFRLCNVTGPLIPAEGATGWLNLLDGAFSLVVLLDGRPAFIRMKIPGRSTAKALLEELQHSLAYFEEHHAHPKLQRLILLGSAPDSEFKHLVADELGIAVVEPEWKQMSPNGESPRNTEHLGLLAATRVSRRGRTSRPFRVNLSSQRRLYVAPLRAGLGFAAVLFIALIVADLQDVKALRKRAAVMGEAVARLRDQDQKVQAQAKAESIDLSDAVLKRLPSDVTFANQLIAKLSFSWTHFLYDLEDVVPPGIAIHNIKLEVKNSSIAMGGSALGLKELTSLILKLQNHPAFKNAVLAQHSVLENGFVDFNLTVRYQSNQRGM